MSVPVSCPPPLLLTLLAALAFALVVPWTLGLELLLLQLLVLLWTHVPRILDSLNLNGVMIRILLQTVTPLHIYDT